MLAITIDPDTREEQDYQNLYIAHEVIETIVDPTESYTGAEIISKLENKMNELNPINKEAYNGTDTERQR